MSPSILFRAATRALAPVVIAATTLATPTTVQGQTIGNSLVARGSLDSFTGFILVSPFSFGLAAVGSELTSVSIFNGIVGRSFTPLLLNALGGNSYQVAGIGTQRTVAASGFQTYAFSAVSGSAVIGATSRVAWMTPVGQPGVIPFDNASDLYQYTNSGSAITSVGETFSSVGSTGRAYSIQFTAGNATSVVPEPATWALVGAGLLVMGGVSRRRRQR